MSDTEHTGKVVDRSDPERVVDRVRERYGDIARSGGGGCGPSAGCCGSGKQAIAINLGYSTAQLELLPDGANLGLGCGAPVEHMDLKPGERVLDLGSGAGIDALLAAHRVGSDGFVIGVDMTPDMLTKARHNAAEARVANVEFREGRLVLPLSLTLSLAPVAVSCSRR
jgi:SAM-dependent methyltransferase